MKYIKLIIIALVLLIIFIAIFQNQELFNQQFTFQLDLKVYETPAYYLKNYAIIGISFVLGIILSIFLGIFSSSKRRSEIKTKNQRIKELEREVSAVQSRSFEETPPAAQSQQSESSSFKAPGT